MKLFSLSFSRMLKNEAALDNEGCLNLFYQMINKDVYLN